MCEILRKFDINTLYICPPYLYTAATLPLEVKKMSFFNCIIHTYFRLFTLSRKKQIATVVLQLISLLTVVYSSCYLCSPILWPVFFISLVIFRATNANPQPALFRLTNIWRKATLPAVGCKSYTFYKVVWWHFSGVVDKG